ncbi:MAG: 2'-5' RNA ligase family protein [Parvularculaceae bacterium]|nr:2'-5' RNA ligase family protein [Parvularculaceae bacterium]
MHSAIILTLQFDEASDALFQDLRRRHYPPGRNRVGAHLTLFHALPSVKENAIIREAARLAKSTPPFPVRVEGPMRLGRGVALRIEGGRLADLRQALAAKFSDHLTGQDREEFRPHVTIQNKVAPHVAAALQDHLAQTLPPFLAMAEGFQLWRCGDGKWTPLAAVPFQGLPG